MAGRQFVVVAAVIVIVLAAVFVFHAGKTTEVVTPEFSEVDDTLSDLESFMDFENQEFDFDMEELYTGWS